MGKSKAFGNDEPVSLAPLHGFDALGALLAIPDPGATKPKHEKAKGKLK